MRAFPQQILTLQDRQIEHSQENDLPKITNNYGLSSKMRIAIFAHSSNCGGAEFALRYLVDTLKQRHEIEIIFPKTTGPEPDFYRSTGITCHCLPAPWATPSFANAILSICKFDFDKIISALEARQYDIAISNTAVILHGGLIARRLRIPHITWLHEDLLDASLMPTSIPYEEYISILQDLSDSFLSCSKHTASQFGHERDIMVFEPYDYRIESRNEDDAREPECILQVIGGHIIRKNIHFAITVVKSLILRGISVRLDIIGSPNNGTNKISRILQKRSIPHRVIKYTANPCQINESYKTITLGCSLSEPYGLTIPESLSRGIPVVYSDCGGPKELLPEEWIYPVNDLDACARKIIAIFNDYDNNVKLSYSRYQQLRDRCPHHALTDKLDALMVDLVSHQVKYVTNECSLLETYIDRIKNALSAPLSETSTIASIQSLGDFKASENENAVRQLVDHERSSPGSAVMNDIERFDVIPFAYSKKMESLYKYGTGLAIELVAHMDQPARIQMLAFIVCSLHSLSQSLGRQPRILAIGDGIGIDAIRLAHSGFNVEYIDYDESVMSTIARENISKALSASDREIFIKAVDTASPPYDAIVCLEVIEHVPSPIDFSTYLASLLDDKRSLYISECFNGVKDQWPTHLLSNESLSGMLPFVLWREFKMIDSNPAIPGKPYIFQKLSKEERQHPLDILGDRRTMLNMLQNQIDIGI